VKNAFDMRSKEEKLITLHYGICQFAFPNYLDFQTMQIIATIHAQVQVVTDIKLCWHYW